MGIGKRRRGNSAAQIDRRDLLPLVAEFPADGLAGLAVDLALIRGQGLAVGSAGGGAFPAGEFFIAFLRIGVAQARQV